MNNLDIYNRCRSVPIEAQKKFNNGRFSGTDINPMWRIKKLTEEFGMCGFGWYYEITNKWMERGEDNIVAAFVDINMYIKIGDEWSKPIQGTGGNTFVSKTKNGYMVSDECYKMALTDAISVAAKAIGIGADIYFESDKTKYIPDEKTDTPSGVYPETQMPSDIIFEMIDKADSKGKLVEIWQTYPQYHRNQKFKNYMTEAKKKYVKTQ